MGHHVDGAVISLMFPGSYRCKFWGNASTVGPPPLGSGLRISQFWYNNEANLPSMGVKE